MRTLNRMWLMAAAVGLAAGCGDDNGGTGPSPSSMVGTWRATSYELSEVANPSNRIDMVGAGATVRLVLTEAKAFTLTISWLGEQEVMTGTWTSSGNALTITIAGETSTFVIGSNRNSMTLVEEHTGFDFDDDGEDEDAHVNMAMVRE